MIRLSILTIALFSTISVQAAYNMRIPLEKQSGGSLPDNSLSWIGGTNGGAVGGGDAGNGEGDTNVGSQPDNEASSKICDGNSEKAKIFFASNFNDVSYNSHRYGEYLTGYPNPYLTTGCHIIFNTPTVKSSNCSSDDSYAVGIAKSLMGLGFNTAQANYIGTCS